MTPSALNQSRPSGPVVIPPMNGRNEIRTGTGNSVMARVAGSIRPTAREKLEATPPPAGALLTSVNQSAPSGPAAIARGSLPPSVGVRTMEWVVGSIEPIASTPDPGPEPTVNQNLPSGPATIELT